MPSQGPIKPTSIKLPLELHARVQHIAMVRKRSVHEVMIRAMETYVDREEKREAIRQECIKAHDEYMLTGLHVTGEEVDAWIDQLVDGNETEMPACHV
ncbi:CopG family transcriptional regulator [Desulfomicrobium sp. ZS1]|uniref:CopG family transcriptional regulator n=1 Tax=Desulfomicrobium baculatum (strain DSM 4028 / VKM B-1378 / X) TaxID=525897 RepID=C7LSA4_DESBD|nr:MULTISPECIES: CopG family transcriptional regulator [Desulfomicrobium]ACU90652.1 CopG family transcriptional regulator [Desulfomicrobium baculatum DSM 4028]UTF49432.1 CopG family transcriptional regulator [Desulfomicrobium sp. ZS1]